MRNVVGGVGKQARLSLPSAFAYVLISEVSDENRRHLGPREVEPNSDESRLQTESARYRALLKNDGTSTHFSHLIAELLDIAHHEPEDIVTGTDLRKLESAVLRSALTWDGVTQVGDTELVDMMDRCGKGQLRMPSRDWTRT